MGPRQKCLGNPDIVCELSDSTVLQWGRDKNVSEIDRSTTVSVAPGSFNGAETKMSRKWNKAQCVVYYI